MAEVMRNVESRQEFWRPAAEEERSREVRQAMSLPSETCDRCGTDFALGARFCHVCGTERDPQLGARATSSRWSLSRVLDLEVIKSGLGLPVASIVAFFIGLICTVAAAVTGFVYSATTLLDWQAVQVWRIEWLLAAVVAFVAGILLKK